MMSFLRKVSLISFRGSPNNIVPAFISDIHDIWYFLKEMRIKMCFLCSYLISLMFEYVCVHKHYSVFHNYIFILFTLWLNSCSSSFVLLSTPSFCICKKSCAPKKKPAIFCHLEGWLSRSCLLTRRNISDLQNGRQGERPNESIGNKPNKKIDLSKFLGG